MTVMMKHECLCFSLPLSGLVSVFPTLSLFVAFLVAVWFSSSVSVYLPAFSLLVTHGHPPPQPCPGPGTSSSNHKDRRGMEEGRGVQGGLRSPSRPDVTKVWTVAGGRLGPVLGPRAGQLKEKRRK